MTGARGSGRAASVGRGVTEWRTEWRGAWSSDRNDGLTGDTCRQLLLFNVW